jgi:hypothetical protein
MNRCSVTISRIWLPALGGFGLDLSLLARRSVSGTTSSAAAAFANDDDNGHVALRMFRVS